MFSTWHWTDTKHKGKIYYFHNIPALKHSSLAGLPLQPLRWTRWAYWLTLLLILTVGVLLRTHHYGAWQDNQHIYFFENEPLLQNGDGYYYLRLARDFRDSEYRPVDELRTVPEHPPRPYPPPLLSVLTVLFSTVTSLSLDWSATILPVPLSLSLVLPVLVLCRQLQIPALPSLAAAVVAVTPWTYVSRTELGFYDTDSLIVFFSLCASVLALGFGLHRTPVRHLYLLGAGINAGFFVWWWDQAPEAVALICLTPFLISAALYYRPQRREGLLAGAGVIGALLAFLISFPEAVNETQHSIREILVHGVKGATAHWPDVRGDISELGAVNWDALINGTIGFSATFLLCLIGFLCLIWTCPGRAAVALTGPIVLALSAFLFGSRALIFWGPPLGLGLAFLVNAVYRLFSRRWPRLGAVVVTGGVIATVALNIVNQMSKPPTAPRVIYLMPSVSSIRERTPEDAVIWTSWTLGYPLMYFTGRRVISDGQFMSGERRVYGNLPLASPHQNFARNFIHFYVAHGKMGLHQIYKLVGSPGFGLRWVKQELGRPPEKAAQALLELSRQAGRDTICTSTETCREFLFPSQRTPVYLLLNNAMFTSQWFRYGTWDAKEEEGEASTIQPLFHIKRTGDTIVLNKNLTFDVNKGKKLRLATGGQVFIQRVKRLSTYTGDHLEIRNYGHPEGFHIEWMPHNGFGAIMTSNAAESLFNRLFIRHTASPEYFRHTVARSPNFSLWEVTSNP